MSMAIDRNTIKMNRDNTKRAGDREPIPHSVLSRRLAEAQRRVEERREIEAATREVWDE